MNIVTFYKKIEDTVYYFEYDTEFLYLTYTLPISKEVISKVYKVPNLSFQELNAKVETIIVNQKQYVAIDQLKHDLLKATQYLQDEIRQAKNKPELYAAIDRFQLSKESIV